MKTEDKDWMSLLAGKDVEGFDDEEKKFFAKIRQEMLDDSLEEGSSEFDELTSARDRKAIIKKLKQSGDIKSNKTRYFPQYAIAASVAMLALTLTLNQEYPDQSPGSQFDQQFQMRDGGVTEDLPKLSITVDNEEKAYKSFKKFLAKNQVQYLFRESEEGWVVVFEATRQNISKLNKYLSSHNISITQVGFYELSLKRKQEN